MMMMVVVVLKLADRTTISGPHLPVRPVYSIVARTCPATHKKGMPAYFGVESWQLQTLFLAMEPIRAA